MIGLIFLTIGAVLIAAYIWLVKTTFRYVKRRTGSTVYASISILGILLLTVGDTLFNRWYVTNVLCTREDVGVKIFEMVKLPLAHWDEVNNRPDLPSGMTTAKPFLGRYVEVQTYERGGLWPLTSFSRRQVLIVDIQTERAISRFVDYEPAGGSWWAFPISMFGSTSLVGWLFRKGSSDSCFENSTFLFTKTIEGPFELVHVGGTK